MNLTEVQIVCRRLWLSDDPEYEFAHKGLQGLLEDYLAESLGSLRPDMRDPAVALLSRMVTEEGLRNVISEDDLIARVANEERIRRERLRAALGSLVSDTRLVRRERREDVIFFEIVSEFLAPWIRKQKAVRHSRAQRRRWISIAIALLCIAVASLGMTLWVLRNRTERAIARDEVKTALAAERRAMIDAEAAQTARARADAAVSVAIAEKNAAQKDTEAARHLVAHVRPQLVLQAEVSRLTEDATKVRTENANLAQKLRTAEETNVRQSQELDSLRSRVASAGSGGMRGLATATAPGVRLMSGMLRPGELKIFTGPPPFTAGLTCFVLESSTSKGAPAGVVIVATTNETQNWSALIGKLSTDFRDAATRLLKDPTKLDTRKKVDEHLRESLSGVSGIHRLLWSGSALSEGPQILKFSFRDRSYELRVTSRAPGEYEIVLFQIGSFQP
ncbi:MAG TPA: hypothetical protein VMJ75_07380 [Candidatus Acidoferrales bacterium]|nr:hypothetical protein [Candidatus Acidoferrales bacterium]